MSSDAIMRRATPDQIFDRPVPVLDAGMAAVENRSALQGDGPKAGFCGNGARNVCRTAPAVVGLARRPSMAIRGPCFPPWTARGNCFAGSFRGDLSGGVCAGVDAGPHPDRQAYRSAAEAVFRLPAETAAPPLPPA